MIANLFPLLLISVGLYGIATNKRSSIYILISLEILLLATILLLTFSTREFDDITAESFNLMIISTAGVESAIGLAIIVSYFRKHKTLKLPKR